MCIIDLDETFKSIWHLLVGPHSHLIHELNRDRCVIPTRTLVDYRSFFVTYPLQVAKFRLNYGLNRTYLAEDWFQGGLTEECLGLVK